LIATLKDRHFSVRIGAAKALWEITGENFGENHAKWRKWWEKKEE
jgi:hypothetical protein